MPDLEEMKREIYSLIVEKGFGFNATEKLLFAFIELGEVGDMYKKGFNKWYISNKKTMKLDVYGSEKEFKEKLAEEVIDVIFYLINFAICEFPLVDLDLKFIEKLQINLNREKRYGVNDKLEH